jgi:hypothetical protein
LPDRQSEVGRRARRLVGRSGSLVERLSLALPLLGGLQAVAGEGKLARSLEQSRMLERIIGERGRRVEGALGIVGRSEGRRAPARPPASANRSPGPCVIGIFV